jgi:hypothetical protein
MSPSYVREMASPRARVHTQLNYLMILAPSSLSGTRACSLTYTQTHKHIHCCTYTNTDPEGRTSTRRHTHKHTHAHTHIKQDHASV